MADDSIDDTIKRYEGVRQQMLAGSGIGSLQQQAYANIQQGYLTPQQAMMAGGQFSGLPPPAYMTGPGMGMFRPATVPVPPPVFAHPGVTSQFADSYEMSLIAQRQALTPMLDPSTAISGFGRSQVNRFGAQWGGVLGGVGGAMLGGVSGAGWGSAIGDMFGGALGRLPVVGDALSWAAGSMNRDAAMQLSAGLRTQYGTMGNISMGQGDMGLGGRGMSAQAGVALAGRFKNLAEQSKGAFNTNDLINVTSTAAEAGLLTNTTNVDAIFEQVNKIMGLVGQVARLTGDPNFRNNIRAMGEMVRNGYTMQDIPSVMAGMNMYSRMAGMTRGEAGVYGQQGAAMFSGAGLTTGLGQQFGIHAAGMANIAQGAFSPAMLNMLGGREGLTQRITASSAAFLTGAGNLLLPYLAQMKEGKIGIDQERLTQLMSGEISLTNVIGQGTANLSDPRMAQQLIIHQQELQDQMGKMAGPMGVQGLQLGIIQNLVNQGIDPETAAVQAAGGDKMQGSMLYQMYTDSGVRDKYRAQITEQRRRVGHEARLQAAARQAAEPGWWGRRYAEAEKRGDAMEEYWTPDFYKNARGRRGMIQDLTAQREARRVDEQADAAINIKRVYGPNWAVSKDDAAAGREMVSKMGEMPWEKEMGQQEYEAIDAAMTGDTPLSGMARGISSLANRVGLVSERDIKAMRVQARGLKSTSKGIEEAKSMTSEAWYAGIDTAREKLGSDWMRRIEQIATKQASARGRDNKPVNEELILSVVRLSMIRKEGEERGAALFENNKSVILNLVRGLLARSPDADVKRAVQKSQDTGGVLGSVDNVEKAQEVMDGLRMAYGAMAKSFGVAERATITDEEQKSLSTFLGADAETQTGAILMAQGETSEEFAAWRKRAGKEKVAAAEALLQRTGGVAAGLGKKMKSRGADTEAEIQSAFQAAAKGTGMLGGFKQLERMISGLGEKTKSMQTLLDVDKGGAMDAQSKKQLQDLDKQAAILDNWASATDKFAQASGMLYDAAGKIAASRPVVPPANVPE